MRNSLVFFYDETFPFAGDRSDAEKLVLGVKSYTGDDAVLVDAAGLAEALRSTEARCWVNLHAPYFPSCAWDAIMSFVRLGGGLLSIGGAPFKRPVRFVDGIWESEVEQTAYHQQLHIHEILKVDATSVLELRSNEDIPLLAGREPLFKVADTWNLVPHVTRSSDLPHQMGSSGPMDTRIYPLLKGIKKDGREVSAPVVLWEHVGGPFAGGRWLFINQESSYELSKEPSVLIQWAAYCAKGVTELWVKPNYASYQPGERAAITLQLQRIIAAGLRGQEQREKWRLSLSLSRHAEAVEWTHSYEAEVTSEWETVGIPVPVTIQPGLYHILCRAESEDGEVRVLRQGFWGRDERLLSSVSPVSAGRDYFEQDGRPLPVVGMTYMTSDVARKFIFLPNADLWDRDMAHMRRAGINWIRTGIWTAYRNVMQVDGHASEEVLRAIDAFLLTAAKNGLHTTFTFFSFTPETWEGVNPYLDPRSIDAQKRFIRAIVSRHRHTTGVDWDLINEPSMFDPLRIFSDGPRTCRDPFERAAYMEWLRARHGTIEALRQRWNDTPDQLPGFDSIELPEPTEINFDIQDIHQGKKGTRWLDYVLFSMDMHNRWVEQLSHTIKELCPDRLVTVGQDEALGAQRPSPFFYGEAVDYTTVHSWWLNDQLIWDGVFAKTAEKPNLVQETGIMYVETPDGRAKRTEMELHHMLERKYAYAFATGGAGAIQWLWNTNFYMDNANESHIGALRADGTEKPEADVSYQFGSFMASIRDLFRERQLEEIAVLFPYSNDFSNRKLAFDATTRAARVLSYELKQPFRAVSEYHLEDLAKYPAKLIILPSAHNVDDAALTRLLEIVRETEATLLWTGPSGLDAYWRPVERLGELLGPRRLVNVKREELLQVAGHSYPVSFGSRRIAQAVKEIREQLHNGNDNDQVHTNGQIVEASLGGGRLLWCPLPVELNDRYEVVSALYRMAASVAGCSQELEWQRGGDLKGLYGRKLTFAEGALFLFVSEFGEDAEVEVKDPQTGCRYKFQLASERSLLFATDVEGKLLSVYRPDEVSIEVECE